MCIRAWVRTMVSVLALGGILSCARAETGGFVVLTSFYPIYIHTVNVTKGVAGVDVANLTPSLTGCLHDYQLTTADMARLIRARILVVNGAGMESFLDQAIRQAPALKVVNASEGIALIKTGAGENPHVWASLALAARQVQNIAAGLARADAGNAEAYQRNARAYVARLEALRDRMHEGLRDLRTRDIVTFHEAFPYFAAEFQLNVAAVIEREPGAEPGARELARTAEIVKSKGVRALFVEPQYPPGAAEAIARETGARMYRLDPAVTGPMDPDAYLRIMEANLAVLKEALK